MSSLQNSKEVCAEATGEPEAQHSLKLTQLLATPDLVHRFACTAPDRDHGGHSIVHDGLVHQDTPGHGSLDITTGPAGMHRSTVGRARLQKGGIQAQPGHRKAQGDDSATLATRLALVNRGQNVCYMNTLVQVIQWLLDHKPSRLDEVGAGRRFFQSLRTQHTEFPTHWCTLVAGVIGALQAT